MMKVTKFLFISLALLGLGCSTQEEEDMFDEAAQFEADLEAIDQYIVDNGLTDDTIHHSTGIRYIIKEEGTGIKPRVGDVIKVDYAGRLLDDTVFDSGENGPFETNLNTGRMILGWYYICQEMNEGDKFTVFIPSLYGYGKNGSGGSVPPNSPLIFEMHMLRVGE